MTVFSRFFNTLSGDMNLQQAQNQFLTLLNGVEPDFLKPFLKWVHCISGKPAQFCNSSVCFAMNWLLMLNSVFCWFESWIDTVHENSSYLCISFCSLRYMPLPVTILHGLLWMWMIFCFYNFKHNLSMFCCPTENSWLFRNRLQRIWNQGDGNGQSVMNWYQVHVLFIVYTR